LLRNCSRKSSTNQIWAPQIERIPGELHLPSEKQNTEIKIIFSGDHPRDFTFSKNGVEIKEISRIKIIIIHDEYIVIFVIKELIKEDVANYAITLKNESGSISPDSFSSFITGIPGPLEGPIKILDISEPLSKVLTRLI